jgi:hypothetical protein
MTQNIITAGDAVNQFVEVAGGNDGTLIIRVGPNGAKVDAISIDAAGVPTFLKNPSSVEGLPAFQCRAWVSFVGSTGAIRASGNVASVVRNGAGDYTITFTTPMPDANFAVNYTAQGAGGSGPLITGPAVSYTPIATQVRLVSMIYTGASSDGGIHSVSIFR